LPKITELIPDSVILIVTVLPARQIGVRIHTGEKYFFFQGFETGSEALPASYSEGTGVISIEGGGGGGKAASP